MEGEALTRFDVDAVQDLPLNSPGYGSPTAHAGLAFAL